MLGNKNSPEPLGSGEFFVVLSRFELENSFLPKDRIAWTIFARLSVRADIMDFFGVGVSLSSYGFWALLITAMTQNSISN